MRFMVLVKATQDSEAGVMPSRELMEAMGRFNEELIAKGMLLAADGLRSTDKGARLAWKAGKLAVTDGPFTETKELIAGYWLIQAESKAAVVEQFSHCPPPGGDGEGSIEIRQVFELEDFPDDVLPPEELAHKQEMRAKLEGHA